MQITNENPSNINVLYGKLVEYANENPARFHMPGHKGKHIFSGKKGNCSGYAGRIPYEIDITEIDGMDDLHNPKDAILKINRDIAAYYGVKAARLLVNGSTAGNLACIFAMINEGDRVIVSRNSHKSIYHALMLRKANPVFIYPRVDKRGITSPVEAKDVERILKVYRDVKLVILTSPIYEGVVSDISDIKSMLEKYNVPLYVDAAQGAHLACEGDVSVASLHKTLPFLTQTSCIRVTEAGKKYLSKIDMYLSCFETSSPSYILMGAADLGMEFMLREGRKKLKNLDEKLSDFYKKTNDLQSISLYTSRQHDKTKLVITAKSSGELDFVEEILKKNGIVFEMKTPGYILCMATLMDEKEDFEKLFEALFEADNGICKNQSHEKNTEIASVIPAKAMMKMDEAIQKKAEEICIDEAAGRISAAFIDMFPPGIPVVVPGEQIEKEHIKLVKNAKEHNINIRGIVEDRISVI